MSNVKEAVHKAIKQAAMERVLLLVNIAYEGVRKRTPVLTGLTRDSWYFMVDGVIVDGVPSVEELENAQRVSLRNSQSHIDELDEEHAIISLTNVEIQDVISFLNSKE